MKPNAIPKEFLKPVSVEHILVDRADLYLDKVEFLLSAWYHPGEQPADGQDKKTILSLINEADVARASFEAIASELIVDRISRNMHDVLCVLFGIGSREAGLHDAFEAFDRRLDMKQCGKWPDDGGRMKALLVHSDEPEFEPVEFAGADAGTGEE